jgi:hypothetical protein
MRDKVLKRYPDGSMLTALGGWLVACGEQKESATMLRIFPLAALVCAAFLARTTVQSQEPTVTTEPLPTAQPNQIVLVGVVPTPPGATVTIEFLDPDTLNTVSCGSTTSTQTEGSGQSEFILAIEASCAIVGFPAKLCWGEGLCDGFDLPSAEGGISYDVGTLGISMESPTPNPPSTGGDTGGDPGLPETGGGRDAAHAHELAPGDLENHASPFARGTHLVWIALTAAVVLLIGGAVLRKHSETSDT